MPFGVPDTTDHPPPIGHNQPPDDDVGFNLDEVLAPDILTLQFETDHAKLVTRFRELMDGSKRFFDTVTVIKTEEIQRKAVEFVSQLKALDKAVEAARSARAKPFIGASKTIQEFFKAGMSDKLIKTARDVEGKMLAFTKAKLAAEKQKRDEEAAAALAKAQEAAAAAQATLDPNALDDAAKLHGRADRAERRAQAAPAAMAQTRSDSGNVASLRSRWDFSVENLADVPTEFLVLDASRVRAAIAEGEREIPGLKIFPIETVKVV